MFEGRDWSHCSCLCLWCVLCCAWLLRWLLAGLLRRRAGMLHLARLLGWYPKGLLGPVFLIYLSLRGPRQNPFICVHGKPHHVVGFANGRKKKWGFRAAFQEETLHRVAPSYAEHSVFTGLGELIGISCEHVSNFRHLRGKIIFLCEFTLFLISKM